MLKTKCKYCNKLIRNCNYKKHIKKHENGNYDKCLNMYHLDHDDLFCKFCKKEYKNKNSLAQHEIRCKNNPNRSANFNPFGLKTGTSVSWNRGLTKDTDERVKLNAINISKTNRKTGGPFKGRHHSEESKRKISESMLKANLGNIKRHSYGKGGYYNNIWFASTYELAYYIYCKDHNINIIRNKKRFKYIYNEGIHNYTPDFYSNDEDLYIEIKGYETDKDISKYKCIKNLKVLYYKDIQHMINYVKEKYNLIDISKLYIEVSPSG